MTIIATFIATYRTIVVCMLLYCSKKLSSALLKRLIAIPMYFIIIIKLMTERITRNSIINLCVKNVVAHSYTVAIAIGINAITDSKVK